MGKQRKLREQRRAAAATPPPPGIRFSELSPAEKDAVLEQLDRLPQGQKQQLINALQRGQIPAVYVPK